jgi:hypothetical protein
MYRKAQTQNAQITSVQQMSVTKISLVQWLITNLNVILYLSTFHSVYICVLILFMIMS